MFVLCACGGPNLSDQLMCVSADICAQLVSQLSCSVKPTLLSLSVELSSIQIQGYVCKTVSKESSK